MHSTGVLKPREPVGDAVEGRQGPVRWAEQRPSVAAGQHTICCLGWS